MNFQIRKAERTQVCPKIAISGPSGSGKTLSALMIAYGITKDWSKILVIDTENSSSELYSNADIKGLSKKIGQFDVIPFGPPYAPERYVQAIQCAEQGNYQVVILDSLSHSWNGTGGALDKVNNSNSSNSYAAWKQVTPIFQRMIDAILQSKCTIICTMRAKQDYVMETNEKGKQVPRKVGMAPIIRDGIEYEFTTVFDINLDHYGFTSKDRTGMFGGQLIMDESIGTAFEQWRVSGAPIRAVEQAPVQYAQNTFQQQPYQQPTYQPQPQQYAQPVQPQYVQQPPVMQQPVAPAAPMPTNVASERSSAISELMSLFGQIGVSDNQEAQKSLISQATGITEVIFKNLGVEHIRATSDFIKRQNAQPVNNSDPKVLF